MVPCRTMFWFCIIAFSCFCKPELFSIAQWNPNAGPKATNSGNIGYPFRVMGSGKITVRAASANADPVVFILSGATVVATSSHAFGWNINNNAMIEASGLTAGDYTIIVGTDAIGATGTFMLSVVGEPATIIAGPKTGIAPGIIVQPTSIRVNQGKSARFSIIGNGVFQNFTWQKQGQMAPIECNAYLLPFISVSAQDAGQYRCIISSPGTSVTAASNWVSLHTLAAAPITNTWSQKKFYIGSYLFFDGILFRSNDSSTATVFKDAGFNLIVCGFGKNWGPFFNDSQCIAYGTSSSPAPVSYMASVLSAVGGIDLVPIDQRFFGNAPYEYPRAINYTSIKNDYAALPLSQSTLITGYAVADEPWYRDLANEPWVPSLVDQVVKIENLTVKDNTRQGWVNLRAYFGFLSWDQYSEMVRAYGNHADTKVLSTDYYLFNRQAGKITYFPMNNPVPGESNVPQYYRHWKLFAETAKANTKQLWAWTHGCEEKIADGRNYVEPDEKHLRYAAFSPLIYGAKALLWYAYGAPGPDASGNGIMKCAQKDGSLRNIIKSINGEINTMSSILMQLSWQRTIHGAAIDPESKEKGLDVMAGNTPPLYGTTGAQALEPGTNATHWSIGNSAVGLLKMPDTTDVLLLFNKSLAKVNSTKYNVAGTVYPTRFDKATGKWKLVDRELNGSIATSFELAINPGDMQMVRLNPGNVLPLVDLSISKIGAPPSNRVDGNADASIITVTGSGSIGVLAGEADNSYFENKGGITSFSASTRILQGTTAQYSGIMIRKSLAATSAMVYLYHDKAAGSSKVCYRSADSGSVVFAASVLAGSPSNTYLRLSRDGDTVKAYGSSDGITYTLLASVTFPEGPANGGLVQTGTNVSTRFANWTLTP